MTLKELRDLLLKVIPKTFHFEAGEQKGNYIVWGEEGPGQVDTSDDKVTCQGIVGTITYFTKDEYDEKFMELQTAMNNAEGLQWNLESIVYDKEDGYIIYLWVFEITMFFEAVM